MRSSNFTDARHFLERAFVELRGEDEFSVRAREALVLLINCCARKESADKVGADNVMRFPDRTERDP